MLAILSNHAYAGTKTVAVESGYSYEHTGKVLSAAVERGLASAERRGRKFRYTITEAGLALLVGDEQEEAQAA